MLGASPDSPIHQRSFSETTAEEFIARRYQHRKLFLVRGRSRRGQGETPRCPIRSNLRSLVLVDVSKAVLSHSVLPYFAA
jgi:hypothetical protein